MLPSVYTIPSCSRHCESKGCAFVDGQIVVSVLKLSQEGGYTRSDYCASCWQEIQFDPEISYWKFSYSTKKKAARLADPEERVMEALQQKLALGDAQDEKTCYILSLYLQRRGALIKRQEARAYSFFEIAASGEILQIKRVLVTASDLIAVEKEMVPLLQSQT